MFDILSNPLWIKTAEPLMILTLNLHEYVNLRREIRQSQKGLTMMSFWQIITPSSFFWFNGDSEQLESRSLDAMLTISKTELKDL